MDTEIGRIASLLESTEEERTPLRREIDRVGRFLGVTVIAIAVVVVAAILLTSDVEGAEGFVGVLLVGVSLAVAAVPEGLSAVLTVVLALGVHRMARRHAIVKQLSSVETLGSATVICSDKTGTLTRNEMTVQRIATRSGEATVTGVGYRPDGDILVDGGPLREGGLADEIRAVLAGGSLANDAVLRETDDGWAIQGDPTDAAFLVAERKFGFAEERAARFAKVGEVPFTSERKLMSALHADAARGGEVGLATKGAPDVLLARCTGERAGADAVPLTDERRRQILATVDGLAREALRTLGVAYRRFGRTDAPDADESLEHGLVFAGVVGIIDPPRPEVGAAIDEAHDAGIRVVMITGDHPGTASRIAGDLGIVGAPDDVPVLTGPDLDALDDDAFRERLRTVSVYARVAPEHKLRIVDGLRDDGELVAVTGDGVNDAPALRAADIGVAMGIAGTDVAKEAANMILADDDFATIVAAVREGRGIFSNIRKFLRYLLSSNLGEVLTVFIGVVAAGALGLRMGPDTVAAPLLATQILWINLVTDSAPALALGMDPAPSGVMRRPPRRLTDRVIDTEMQLGVLFVGVVMAAATLLTIDAYLPGGLIAGTGSLELARTAGFTVLVLAQLFNALNSRSARESVFHGLFRNPSLWIAIGVSVALQVLVVHAPFLHEAFGTTDLTASGWAFCVAMASTVLWAEELKKLAVRLAAARGSVAVG
jgi:calcium-translocating P-type ATPase